LEGKLTNQKIKGYGHVYERRKRVPKNVFIIKVKKDNAQGEEQRQDGENRLGKI
jgi:hypothetical protein